MNQLRFHVSIVYSIGAVIHPENKKLLKLIKNYFNEEGSISTCKNLYLYKVSYSSSSSSSSSSSIKELKFIRSHFKNYPLQTSKRIYFQLWWNVMDIIENKEYLTKEGFLNILSIKNNNFLIPKGLSLKVLDLYPNINCYNNSIFEFSKEALNCYWIVGFVQADGSLYIYN